MTILIKGMEVPQNCCECGVEWCERWKGLIIAGMSIAKARPTDCPLIEVPTPHGRLIDADAMVGDDNEAYKTAQLALMGAGSGADAMRMVYEVAHKNLQMFIADAPTVIEAEKEV